MKIRGPPGGRQGWFPIQSAPRIIVTLKRACCRLRDVKGDGHPGDWSCGDYPGVCGFARAIIQANGIGGQPLINCSLDVLEMHGFHVSLNTTRCRVATYIEHRRTCLQVVSSLQTATKGHMVG